MPERVDGYELLAVESADPLEKGELVRKVRLHHLRTICRNGEPDTAVDEDTHRVE